MTQERQKPHKGAICGDASHDVDVAQLKINDSPAGRAQLYGSTYGETPAPHPDDVAVDRFAAAMKQKLGHGVAQQAPVAPAGSGGWQFHAEDMERQRDYWRSRAQLMQEHQQGQCWYWQGDGGDHPESMASGLPVVIRADQLRALMQRAPQPTEKEAQLVLERDSARAAYDRQCRVTNEAYAKIRKLEQAAQQAPVAQNALAFSEASSLATSLFKKHFANTEPYKSGEVVWGLCDTTAGIISQIDNMVSGLVMPVAQGEPVLRHRVRVHLANRYSYSHKDFCEKLEEIINKDCRQEVVQCGPFGYVYSWVHSSALGRPDETYTGFAKLLEDAKRHPAHFDIQAVFITPQQASEPMTESEIWESDAIMEVNADAQISMEHIVRFVRAVERHHQIKGKQ